MTRYHDAAALTASGGWRAPSPGTTLPTGVRDRLRPARGVGYARVRLTPRAYVDQAMTHARWASTGQSQRHRSPADRPPPQWTPRMRTCFRLVGWVLYGACGLVAQALTN
jgi:hypothetical protein